MNCRAGFIYRLPFQDLLRIYEIFQHYKNRRRLVPPKQVLRDIDKVPRRLLRPHAGPEPGLTPRVDVAVVGRSAAVSPVPNRQSVYHAKGEQ